MKFASALVATMLACVVVLGIGGCDDGPVAERRTDEAVAGSVTPHGTSVDIFGMSSESMTLDDALEAVGVPVLLPDTQETGAVSRVLLNETGADAEGSPGIAVLYSSGIKLFVQRTPHDLSDLGADAAPFSDGRSTALTARSINGVDALVCEPGVQEDGSAVTARLIWNDTDMGYSLVAPEGTSTSALIDVLRSMTPQGDA